MNYPEELRERYNEVMFSERDIIEKFLKDHYDIRYGRQRDTWHFEPAVELVANQGSHVLLHDIKLDEDRFVVFYVEAFCDKNAEWECFDFAYGELRKVIEALPSIDEIIKIKMMADIKRIVGENTIVWMTGKRHLICGEYDVLMVSPNGFGSYKVTLRKNNINSVFPLVNLNAKHLTDLRNHLYKDRLQHSPQYKELMELLSLEENMRFECHNYGDATFVIDGTDVTFDVSSVRRNDNGGLVIYGNDIDADVCDNIELTEKDIKPEYLVGIINEMKRSKYSDIMDTHNAHNEELVRKINAAWKSEKYHDRFGDILFAIGCRDAEEIMEKYDIRIDCNETAMDNAHEIMEGVCDDWDLETILSFIRYKE